MYKNKTIRSYREALNKIIKYNDCCCGSYDPIEWDDSGHAYMCVKNIAKRALERLDLRKK